MQGPLMTKNKNKKELFVFILVSRKTIPFGNKEIFPKEQYFAKN